MLDKAHVQQWVSHLIEAADALLLHSLGQDVHHACVLVRFTAVALSLKMQPQPVQYRLLAVSYEAPTTALTYARRRLITLTLGGHQQPCMAH